MVVADGARATDRRGISRADSGDVEVVGRVTRITLVAFLPKETMILPVKSGSGTRYVQHPSCPCRCQAAGDGCLDSWRMSGTPEAGYHISKLVHRLEILTYSIGSGCGALSLKVSEVSASGNWSACICVDGG